MLKGLDVHHRALGLFRRLDGAHFQHVRVLPQQVVGHVGHGGLGCGGLAAMLQAEGQHHLALPQGDGVHQRGLDLLQHLGVVVLQQAGLGAHLHRDHPGQLQIVELLLEPVQQVCKVVAGLSVLLGAGLGGLLPQLDQVVGAEILQPLLAGDDVHGQLFIVLGVQLIHLVEHGDVLHQGHLVLLQYLDDAVHVGLRLGIAGLHGLQLAALFLEQPGQALLLRLAEGLQLAHQLAEGIAHLAQVLRFHVAQGAFRERGDVLLGRRAILQHQVGVGDVDLLCKVIHHLPLRLAEHGFVDLHGVGLPLGLGGLLGGLGLLLVGVGLQGQAGGLGGGGSGVGGEGQLGGQVHSFFAHLMCPPVVFGVFRIRSSYRWSSTPPSGPSEF